MREVPLAEVAEWGSGGTPNRSVSNFFGKGVPWLSIADLNDGMVYGAKESLTELGVSNSSAKMVPTGTVFVAMYGSIGKLGISADAMCTSQAIAFAIPKPQVVDQRYFFHYLLNERPRLQALGRGGTQKNIGQGDLKALKIPLPPIDEQRRIAAILDQADGLRAKRRQVLTHLDALTQAIFHDMFGRSRFPTRRFDDVVLKLEGGRSLVADDSAAVSEYRVLKISAVTTNRFLPGESKPLPAGYVPLPHHLVRLGDLLFSRANTADLVGAVALVDQDVEGLALPDKLWRFVWREPADVEPLYMWMLLQSSEMRHELSSRASGTGGSMKNISKAKLGGIGLSWPSMELQREFAARIRVVNEQSAEMHLLATRSDELFASLQFRAFRGEL